jgi:hypothetical protein
VINLDEQNSGTDPNSEDTDGDGLTDYEEMTVYLTEPTITDTDGDGVNDYDEVMQYNSDPLVSSLGNGIYSYPEYVGVTSPLAYWKLDDGSAGEALDETGSYQGYYANTQLLQAPIVENSLNAAYFNGSSSAMHVSGLPALQDFSFSVWVQPTSLSGHRTLVGRDRASGAQGAFYMKISSSGNGVASISIFSDSGTVLYARSRTVLQPNQLYHITATYSQLTGTVRIYVNGVLENETSISGFVMPVQTNDLLLGAGYYNRRIVDYSAGYLDEFSIYNRALSGKEVAQLYMIGAGVPVTLQ